MRVTDFCSDKQKQKHFGSAAQPVRALNKIYPQATLIIIMVIIKLSSQTRLKNPGLIIKVIGMIIESAGKRRL